MGTTGGRDGGDSLRGLTAAGPSKVGTDKAMRARDVSRPREEPEDDEKPQSVGGSGSAGSSPDSS